MDAYTLRKNSKNENFHYKFPMQFQTMYEMHAFNTRFDGDKDSLSELHAEEMRVLKDMKMRSGRTGVSASRIRKVVHLGCDVGGKHCPYHKKHKKMNTFKNPKSDVNKLKGDMLGDD
jgi:hypothetical protein